MNSQSRYSIRTEVEFQPLQVIDVEKLIDACQEKWQNRTLCQVNDCVVRLGVIQGEFHWHKHDREDEFFYVVNGRLYIDLEEKTIDLTTQQGFVIPKGILHRTRAPERTSILMIEGGTVTPIGD
ncbi:MAG: cupin domain-containing protein [Candidatus Aminicenantes bacterium]|nr:MAG: cupin domain-containing protein [Candidatus Aminicenantes bacterium]